jgi:hypothetical protein
MTMLLCKDSAYFCLHDMGFPRTRVLISRPWYRCGRSQTAPPHKAWRTQGQLTARHCCCVCCGIHPLSIPQSSSAPAPPMTCKREAPYLHCSPKRSPVKYPSRRLRSPATCENVNPPYLSFVSVNRTCFRTTGSYFTNCSLFGRFLGFFFLT